MKVKFKGRTVNDSRYAELECNTIKDNYDVSQRSISVVVRVNGKVLISLKEYFEVEVIQ